MAVDWITTLNTSNNRTGELHIKARKFIRRETLTFSTPMQFIRFKIPNERNLIDSFFIPK